MSYEPLRIIATDKEDLDIILSLLQDSLIPVVSIAYDKEKQTLTMLANRFCWEVPEEDADSKPVYLRCHAGLLFRNVQFVQEKNIDQKDTARVLSFLMGSITDEHVYLIFSDDACIRLSLNELDISFADIDEPWTTRSKPEHLGLEEYAVSEAL